MSSRCLRGLDVCIGLSASEEAAMDKAVNDRAIQMGKLREVPVSVANSLLKGGQNAIQQAMLTAAVSDLPGQSAREKVYWKLQWHADNLKKFTKPDQIYPSGDDLKNWVLQAFTEWDAAVEGAEALNDAWWQMWKDIGANLAALPVSVAKAASSLARSAEDAAKNVAWYAKWTYWIAIGAAVLGVGIIATGVSLGAKNKIERL